jgi:hypothetical protein
MADFDPRKAPGLKTQGNIDIFNRPRVRNKDGSISTVRSMSVNFGNGEVLIPTVSDDGRVMSEDEAIQTYRKSGRHLGIFDTPANATAYAKSLHQQQERLYVPKERNVAGLNVGSFDETYNDPGLRSGPDYGGAPGLNAGSAPDPQFGGQMDTMQSMLAQGPAQGPQMDPGLNQRAKVMQQLQRKAQQLRNMGMEPQEIDVLLRGQMGALQQGEEDAYMQSMRKFAMIQRVQAVPGMQKSLQSWSPDGAADPRAQKQMQQQEALKALGFGGGGQTMEDLMR